MVKIDTNSRHYHVNLDGALVSVINERLKELNHIHHCHVCSLPVEDNQVLCDIYNRMVKVLGITSITKLKQIYLLSKLADNKENKN